MHVGYSADDPRRFWGQALTGSSGRRYTLAALLGEGSQGLVFATAEPFSYLAIKVLRPSFVRAYPAMARVVVEKEYASMARLAAQASPFLLRMHDVGILPWGSLHLPFLAFDRISESPTEPLGLTFAARVRQAVESTGFGLDPPRALRLLGRIASGILAIHSAHLVHRDLKPSNVLVAGGIDDEHPFIADFGIVRAAGLAPTMGAGFRLGAPGFAAPEVSDPRRVGPACDVFSFAALAHLALAGEPRFRGSDLAILALVKKEAGAPLPHCPRVHPALRDASVLADIEAVLRRALTANERLRPWSIQEVWSDLGKLLCKALKTEAEPASDRGRLTAGFDLSFDDAPPDPVSAPHPPDSSAPGRED